MSNFYNLLAKKVWVKKTKYTLVVKLLNICVGCKGATYNKKVLLKKCEGESKIKSSNLKIENGEKVVPSLLRRYVINKDGWVCSECKNIEWNSKHIPLVLDHINGNPYNNSLKNLRMLCCNCDAQTPTYKSKNNGNGRHERMKRYYNKKLLSL